MKQINFNHESSTLGASLGLTEKEVYIANLTTKFVHLQPLMIIDNVFDDVPQDQIEPSLKTNSGVIELLGKCVGDNIAVYTLCMYMLKEEKEDAHFAHVLFEKPDEFKKKVKAGRNDDDDSDDDIPQDVKIELFMVAMKKKHDKYKHMMRLIKETGYDYQKFISAVDNDENLKFVPESEKPKRDLPGFLRHLFGGKDDDGDDE